MSVPQLPEELWIEILLHKWRDWEREWMLNLSEAEYLMYGDQGPVSPEEMAEARLHPQRAAGRWDAQTGRP